MSNIEIDRGYVSPQFVTNPEESIVEFENAREIADQKRSAIKRYNSRAGENHSIEHAAENL